MYSLTSGSVPLVSKGPNSAHTCANHSFKASLLTILPTMLQKQRLARKMDLAATDGITGPFLLSLNDSEAAIQVVNHSLPSSLANCSQFLATSTQTRTESVEEVNFE
ncbi:hypothetical protein HA402_014560 [Bradysia odoriphaga]|nr:hypothetical protein HA402_014560 [Bradysia odoriphaga]